eukprot:scaffold517_cov392-Prasinococcus_capsulatus_cf.AAC.9
MSRSILLFFAACAATLSYVQGRLVAPEGSIIVEADATESLAPGWAVRGPSPRDAKIELVFAVRQRNVKQLAEEVLAVSTPSSPKYGQHLSNKAVHELVAPSPVHARVVHEFLVGNGVTDIQSLTPNGDMIQALVTVEMAELLLHAEYEELYHAESGLTIHRCITSGYSLPEQVSLAVDFVAPTVRVPTIRSAKGTSYGARTRATPNTPEVLRRIYNVGDAQGSASNNKAAVTAFLEQYYSQSALQKFYDSQCADEDINCGIDNSASDTVITVGDAGAEPGAGIESMLDIEYITALGSSIKTEFWGFAGRSPDNPENEPFLKWLNLVSNTTDAAVPKVFSSSYGEDEQTCSMAWAERLNTEFMKTGARGISLLFASGDSGAAGDNGCIDGKFVPQWPSGSPWVTGVGGTQNPDDETAIGLSSGGFSNRWDRPEWQRDPVAVYLTDTLNLPPRTMFNDSGRGIPDIAAQATGFLVNLGIGPPISVAGTSCACPTAAGVIAQLNDLRLQAGKSTLGFLNPLIYTIPSGWHDITEGYNDGCGFGSKGFPATGGWDAVTGLGTPDYESLKTLIANLP